MNAWVGIVLLVFLALYVGIIVLVPIAFIFALNTLFSLGIETNFLSWCAAAVLFFIVSNITLFQFKTKK